MGGPPMGGPPMEGAPPMGAPPMGAPPMEEAPPPPPPETPNIEEIIQKIQQMPPAEALDTIAEIFPDNAELLKIIEESKKESPEGQAETVELILNQIREMI